MIGWQAYDIGVQPRDYPHWRWTPTVGDSTRSFDLSSYGGLRANSGHYIAVHYYVDRPDYSDYTLTLILEERTA